MVSAAIVAALILTAPTHAQTSTPDLSGMWKINADLSDKPAATADRGQPGENGGGDQPPPGGGRGRGGRGGYGGGYGGGMRGGGGMGGGARRDPQQMAQVRDFMKAALAMPDTFTIVQHDGEVSLTDTQGQVTNLITDGRKEKHVVGSATADTETKWTGTDLVEELSSGSGPKVTRTYSVITGPDGAKELKVVSKAEGGGRMRRQIAITRVYDRANP